MKYQITIDEKAQSDLKYFLKYDKKNFAKAQHLILDLVDNPFGGVGKPEPLKFESSGYWSKRISKEHRLVYEVKKNTITVISCRYHY